MKFNVLCIKSHIKPTFMVMESKLLDATVGRHSADE